MVYILQLHSSSPDDRVVTMLLAIADWIRPVRYPQRSIGTPQARLSR